MQRISCTYNSGYEMADTDRQKLAAVYQQLPSFCGNDDNGCPNWYGRDGDARYLWASVEPGGLLVAGMLDESEWQLWDGAFRAAASRALGYDVRDADE